MNNIETDINRERKFNTVSKLKQSLDAAQSANARKFKARYKQTNNAFLREVEAIIRLANIEMDEIKGGGKKLKRKTLDRSDRKESVYTLHKKAKEEMKRQQNS